MTKPNTPKDNSVAASGALLRVQDALEEIIILMEATRRGEYKPDSFTCQPAEQALTELDALIDSVPEGEGVLGKAIIAKQMSLVNSVDMGGKHVMPVSGEQRICATAKILHDAVKRSE